MFTLNHQQNYGHWSITCLLYQVSSLPGHPIPSIPCLVIWSISVIAISWISDTLLLGKRAFSLTALLMSIFPAVFWILLIQIYAIGHIQTPLAIHLGAVYSSCLIYSPGHVSWCGFSYPVLKTGHILPRNLAFIQKLFLPHGFQLRHPFSPLELQSHWIPCLGSPHHNGSEFLDEGSRARRLYPLPLFILLSWGNIIRMLIQYFSLGALCWFSSLLEPECPSTCLQMPIDLAWNLLLCSSFFWCIYSACSEWPCGLGFSPFHCFSLFPLILSWVCSCGMSWGVSLCGVRVWCLEFWMNPTVYKIGYEYATM